MIGRGWPCCDWCDRTSREYECRATADGKGLDGIRSGVKHPDRIAVQAAFFARDIARWSVGPEEQEAAARREALIQHRMFYDVLGELGRPDPRWPLWRTDTVRLVAREIYRRRAFDQLPILADALQDAGCDDEAVLSHCRDPNSVHVRGCWVVDLAMGGA